MSENEIIEVIENAIEDTHELLYEHDHRLGRTTAKNKNTGECLELQIEKLKKIVTYINQNESAISIIEKRIEELEDISKESHADFIENEIKALESILKEIKGEN